MLAFALIEMAIPWFLLTNAEKRLPSGVTGLLVACVPIAGAIAGYALGDRHALRPIRLAGIAIGFGGVALLVGGDLRGAHGIPWWSVAQVMLVCVGYATAPFIVGTALSDVPTLGVIAVSLAAVAIGYAPLAWWSRPSTAPPAGTWWAIVGLAVICTGIAFVTFFELIAEVGPVRATLITFANPAVAVLLGAVFLDEHITLATLGGFVLVLTGCWFTTRGPTDAATGTDAAAPSRGPTDSRRRRDSWDHETGTSTVAP